MNRPKTLWVIGVNLVATVLTAAVVGPSISKLEDVLGLVGWAARTPFYLVPMYLSPLAIRLRPGPGLGIVLGLLVAVPLALWAIATMCPAIVPASYLASGALQGALVGWIGRREASSPCSPPAS